MKFLYLIPALLMAACLPEASDALPRGTHYQTSRLCQEGDGRALFDLGPNPRGIELRICVADSGLEVCQLVQGASHTSLEQENGLWSMTYPCLEGELLTVHWFEIDEVVTIPYTLGVPDDGLE